MSASIERFEHFLLARRATGEPLELSRSASELAMLAFDSRKKRLVELHVVTGVAGKEATLRRSAKERALMAAEVRAPSFSRVLTVGEDDGLVYYTSTLNDGELVEDYIKRRGALPAATAFCLLLHLLEDLVQLQAYHRLIAKVSLSRLLVTTLEDTFLQLRVSDFGLSEKEDRSEGDLKRLCSEVCELTFLLLTGQVFEGQKPDSFPALTCLPTSLRTTLRNTLADRNNAPALLDKLRDEVKEAFTALVSSLQVRNTRKHLVISSASLLPESQLQTLLLENVPVGDLLRGALRADESEGAQRYPFTLPARNTRDDMPLTVHLLPASRIVPKDQYEAVPLQMWRFDAQKHPNILRSLSVWESPDWTFLTEERESGFPLSRLIAERITLNPAEVSVLLRQVKMGVDQAAECGVNTLDLHPSNLLLKVGKQGPMQAREFEKLMLKRVDSWPSFVLKLRPHATMRGLYEQLLVDASSDHDEQVEESRRERDQARRSFVALAAYMLTGERQVGRQIEFPETVSPALGDYVRNCLQKAKHLGQTPSQEEFLAEFEKLMGVPAEAEGFAARYRGVSTTPVEEMESVGSVSDFDDDLDSVSNAPVPAPPVRRNTPTQRLLAGPQPLNLGRPRQANKGVVGMVLWGVICLVLGIFVITLFAGDNDRTTLPPERSSIRRAIIPTREELNEFHQKQLEEAKRLAAEKQSGHVAERTSAP